MSDVGMLDVLAGVASVATIGGLFYAGYQLRQARMAASATTSAHILSNIRSRIEDVSNQINERSLYAATCDLLNELELSCAIYFDGQFGGRTGKLSVSFIKDILRMLENNPKMLACVKRAIQEPDTFECLRKFARKYKKDWQGFVSPSVHSQQSGERAQMVGSQDEI